MIDSGPPSACARGQLRMLSTASSGPSAMPQFVAPRRYPFASRYFDAHISTPSAFRASSSRSASAQAGAGINLVMGIVASRWPLSDAGPASTNAVSALNKIHTRQQRIKILDLPAAFPRKRKRSIVRAPPDTYQQCLARTGGELNLEVRGIDRHAATADLRGRRLMFAVRAHLNDELVRRNSAGVHKRERDAVALDTLDERGYVQ